MSEPDDRSPFLRIISWVLAALFLIVLLYLGSYFALVTESNDVETISFTHERILPAYRLGGDTLRPFYQPIHDLDVVLRPDTWIRHRFRL